MGTKQSSLKKTPSLTRLLSQLSRKDIQSSSVETKQVSESLAEPLLIQPVDYSESSVARIFNDPRSPSYGNGVGSQRTPIARSA